MKQMDGKAVDYEMGGYSDLDVLYAKKQKSGTSKPE